MSRVRPEYKPLTKEDFGMTEDEFNNFIIDVVQLLKDFPEFQPPVITRTKETGEVVTVQLTREMFNL